MEVFRTAMEEMATAVGAVAAQLGAVSAQCGADHEAGDTHAAATEMRNLAATVQVRFICRYRFCATVFAS